MSTQPSSRILNSVLEDQEQHAQHTAAHPIASSLLPPIGSTTSLSGRRRSLSRRNSFGISSIPALAAAQAAANFTPLVPLDTIQSVPENTLKPNAPGSSDRPLSRPGAISLDLAKEEKSPVEIKSTVESVVDLPRKKYNVPESTRNQSFIRKEVGLATVGSYNPYPDSWTGKKYSHVWSKSSAVRFPETKNECTLGPGSYDAAFDYIHPRSLNVGSVAFKTRHQTFKLLTNPDIGPTTYSVDIVKRNRGFIPWVKQVQNSLQRVINFKDPIRPTPHVELIADISKSVAVKPKSVQENVSIPSTVVPVKPIHPMNPQFLIRK